MPDGTLPLSSTAPLVQSLLTDVRSALPVVNRTLLTHGDLSLAAYLQQVTVVARGSYQPVEDVAAAVYRCVAPLLGEAQALQASEELLRQPVVLTTNHHGVDFFAQSVQGTLLFSQREICPGEAAQTVPVFACGSVAMNNLTYPRGALSYAGGDTEVSGVPVRIPVFPDRVKRQLVSRVAGLDAGMVTRAGQRVSRLAAEGQISADSAAAFAGLLKTEFSAADVLACTGYSDQATLLNARVWRKLFRPSTYAPALIYLELEKIATLLLELDLANTQSLVYRLLFDARLRQRLLVELEGAKGCWQQAETFKQGFEAGSGPGVLIQRGTFMFWGVDERGRRVALACDASADVAVLRGCDDAGQTWCIELTPDALLQQLAQGRLLPSLFTCYLVISLARGVTCAGGYYQAEYLPVMQQGVVQALRATPDCDLQGNDAQGNGSKGEGSKGEGSRGYDSLAEQVAGVPCDVYLSGMQAVMRDGERGGLLPVGPLEIIAAGGLDRQELTRITQLSVQDAHLASLLETLPDVLPGSVITSSQCALLARELCRLLGKKVVHK